jgi:hypothetical protein
VVRFLAFLLTVCWPMAAQSDPAILQIRILEGEGAVYPIGARATRGITVQVTDETGKPVENAAVSFRLPDDGSTGAFSSGMRTEIATTGADGCASVWGMQWNRVTGPLEVRITAAKGQARAGTVCGLFLSDAASTTEPRSTKVHGWRSHRKIWLGIAIAAGAFAGVAAVTSRGTPGAASGNGGTVNAPQIGTPTITIGKP